MIDIKKFREDADFFKKKWADRGLEVDVNEILAWDTEWRESTVKVEELKSQRNTASKQIGIMKKNGEDASSAMEAVRSLGDQIKELDAKAAELSSQVNAKLLSLPNPPSEFTPVGLTEEDNPEVRRWGTKPEFDFAPQAHWDLGQNLDILDLPRAAKISGSGFYLWKGAGARLERALINFFLDQNTENGYKEAWVPFVVNPKAMTGTGQLPKFAEEIYHAPEDNLYLVPTAEVPVTNIHADEILDAKELPIAYTAYTPCFRREAGAAGKDSRGILRVHQFSKVEMVKFVEPSTSYTELEMLLADAEHLLQQLGLHYRVIELCSGDLGFSAARCYDIEVWAPGTERYLEVSSCSNFEDFQSRRCKIRYKEETEKKAKLLHTLNGSGLALPRCIVALMETYQRADGSIEVPDVLVPYMGGLTEISAEG
ncbi:seryl-tRNA synthetase [Lentisphaera araneosa HTCC2155]|uniref:Serine--tRNA ligase n=1 Tax=Lentisphaera araneosa HTCC2155 TaxID=313628 RepID=A6DNS8_9BACT|nr:serine--tRNA ligase [Lentisphaera araneosa]EDM26737.1 seryl-tRNA synthetase [Lentisphaera araneosa HTCC2155]